jgi:hypothetical protein
MEEERVEQSTAEDKGEDAPSSNASDDVAQEISRLVEAMARAARSVWSSEQRHQLETDLRRCLGSLVGNVEDALSRFSQSEQGKELHEHASKVADRVSKSALAAELKDGLAQGIKTAATEVQKFADGLEKQEAETAAPQDIPVEPESEEKK